MSNARTLAAFLAGALVALPGLALAQAPFQTPPVETPPVEVPVEPDLPDEPDGDDEDDAAEVEEREAPEPQDADEDALEVEEQDEDEGDGAVVSALAECLPSGSELHGTGLTKGFFMRQAHTGEVSPGEDADTMPLTTEADADAVCAAVQALAGEVEAPETAKGRPDWAGPKDDREPGARGRDRAAEAKADRGR